MARHWTRRHALAAGAALLVGSRGDAAPPKLDAFTGVVRPLADVLGPLGAKLDAEAAPHWLALVTADGKIYPLIKDEGTRVFSADRDVLNRPMRIMGRLLPGSQMLQAIQVHSVHKGVIHDLYYWCDICSIRRRSKMTCECCGGPMERKEVALKK
jgi:hypothetical protein